MADEKIIPAYDAEAIELKWQKVWEQSETFKARDDSDRPKKYVLEMFPYPSGDLHMGHARNYTIGDAMARQARMRGYEVLHPMGFDAFGLPAENAAIKNKTQAGAWTYKNMDQAIATMKRMGFSYDYDRLVRTCDPDYYKWGQWAFLKMWEKGLAYRATSPVNWCPSCNTVLANEQVVDGKCWRCGSVPEKRELSQWYLKITDYAQELLDDLDQLTGWPENVKAQQRNWIGRSEGAEIDFALAAEDGVTPTDRLITVFTTRADTLYGTTFFLLPPESALAAELVAGTEHEAAYLELKKSVEQVSSVDRQGSEREKHGVFTGRYVINPLTGKPLPIWVADYILLDYGTGAVMGVPCGDQRDFDFARKYGLDIPPIIAEKDDPLYEQLKDQQDMVVTNVDWDHAMVAEGYLIQSGPFTGMRGGKHSEAVDAIIDYLGERGVGRKTVQFRLRDWLISRQRYWGNPIPMIHCDCCGDVPVPYEDLPVMLPEDLDLGAGETLAEYAPFYETTCPKCGKPAKRITDTMDTFTCSSWYFLRYCDPHNTELPFSKESVDHWMAVDNYILHRRHRARDPAPALLALLDQGHARPGHDRPRRALCQPAVPGHGQGRQRRHHEQVQGQRGASLERDWALWRRHHASGDPVHRPVREGLQLGRGGRGGCQPLHQARLAHRVGPGTVGRLRCRARCQGARRGRWRALPSHARDGHQVHRRL